VAVQAWLRDDDAIGALHRRTTLCGWQADPPTRGLVNRRR
jgi:hypothetical protein